MIGKSGADFKGDSKKVSVIREDFVLAVIQLTELEEKTVANFTVKNRGGVSMKRVVSILPTKNHLGEEEGDESFGPDRACELLNIHVEVAVVSLLKVGPGTTDVSAKELIPSYLCLALACIGKGR